MSKQVITIKPDGSVFGLDHKRKGLSLRTLGRADTTRVTLIEWSEREQAWFIQWTEFPAAQGAGRRWTYQTFNGALVNYSEFNGTPLWGGVVYFYDYEDANAAEVAVIQALQKKGELVG
jgi:hypothetical protein